MTSLLSHTEDPALELVYGYHERWEIELSIYEVDIHQRLTGRTLGSLKPVGLIQELPELYTRLLADIAPKRLPERRARQPESAQA